MGTVFGSTDLHQGEEDKVSASTIQNPIACPRKSESWFPLSHWGESGTSGIIRVGGTLGWWVSVPVVLCHEGTVGSKYPPFSPSLHVALAEICVSGSG